MSRLRLVPVGRGVLTDDIADERDAILLASALAVGADHLVTYDDRLADSATDAGSFRLPSTTRGWCPTASLAD